MISIKDKEIVGFLSVPFDKILIDIVLYLEFLYPNRVIFTCGYRPGDSGVHGCNPCRGIDIRSRIFSHPDRVVKAVNERWRYDYVRPEKAPAILHDSGQGMHIHLQSHPNTMRV